MLHWFEFGSRHSQHRRTSPEVLRLY